MSDTESLSAEDLRSRLYSSLREKGLVDALKSQLRNKLVSELRTVGVQQPFRTEPQYAEEGSLLHKAANSLTADHMRRCHYDYSLSIFLPESGTTEDKIFTTTDLLQLLNISPHSKLYKHLATTTAGYHKKGFLWQLLCEIASLCGSSSRDSCVQTDPAKLPPPCSLEEQFRKVDSYYEDGEESNKRRWQAVEERILSYQHQLEERSRSEIQMEVARFKDNELARMRIEEKEKSRQEIEKIRREMESAHKVRSDALVERERHAIERLQKQQEIAEKETYAQRQSILEEIESVRHRENDTRRKDETLNREHGLWEDKLKTREELVKRREDSVRKAEIEYENKLHDECKSVQRKYQLEEQARYMERNKDLEYREIRVRENERRLDDELRDIQQVKDELRQKRRQCTEMESELSKARHDLITAQTQADLMNEKLRDMVDYQIVKEDNVGLKRELEGTRMRTAELTRDNMVERQKQEELMREMTDRAGKPTPEVYLIQKELDKVRHEARQERAVFEHQRNAVERRLQEQVDHNQDLLRKFEEQTLQQKEMNHELTDLRQQLGHTRQALNNEVYRKPKPSLLTSQIIYLKDKLRTECQLEQSSRYNRSESLCDLSGGSGEGDYRQEQSLVHSAPGLHRYSSPGTHSDNIHTVQSTPAKSSDYSYSMDIVEDTKRRLRSLEKEAENLEHHYRNFQFRQTTAMTETDIVHPPLLHTGQSRVHFQYGDTHTSVPGRSPYNTSSASRRSGHNASLSSGRALSSTPAKRPPRADIGRPYSPPTNEIVGDHSLINNSMSTVRSSSPGPLQDDRPTRSRPLSVDDLEARPGSPSIVVVPGGSDSNRSQASQHAPQASPSDGIQRVTPSGQEDVVAAPVTLDTAWKPPAAPVSMHAASQETGASKLPALDTAWKQPALDTGGKLSSLDSAWKSPSLDAGWKSAQQKEEEERRQREEDRQYDEERRQREEERKRKEAEAWEREQRELRGLRGEGEAQTSPDQKPSEPDNAEEAQGENIDPVMQKYMEMVKQQKDREKDVTKKAIDTWNKGKAQKTPSVSEDLSISDDKSDAGVADISNGSGDFW